MKTVNQDQEANPVEIWEGIDTGEETSHNCLTKLAIHILSVVANSAGCERAFSHMGLVHTGICSKLGVEKVRKTTMVGMDIKCTHLEAGLLCKRGKQKFTSEAGVQLEGPNDLIAGAASANADKDVGDDLDDTDEIPPAVTVQAPSGPLTITIPPYNPVTQPAQTTGVKKTCIPLKILFKYPTGTELPSEGMNSFWRGGIENLEKEMEAYDILSGLTEENSDSGNL